MPNPVTLIPNRTFLEVEQPGREFVLRIKDSSGAPAFMLVEAEGGLWKHEAMLNVKDFLANALADETELMKNITIIA